MFVSFLSLAPSLPSSLALCLYVSAIYFLVFVVCVPMNKSEDISPFLVPSAGIYVIENPSSEQ